MALENLRGRVSWVFAEDDFDVDQIVGVKNIKITDVDELAAVAMQAYDPDFAKAVKPGDLLVGGRNFGYGHPHYPPLRAMRHLGIRALLAESFSPGFWRGEVSMGFPQVTCPGILDFVERWDEIEVDFATNQLRNHTKGRSIPFDALSQSEVEMLAAGGLVPYLKRGVATAS